ncbi:MAG: hypothetical protein JRF33_22630 [Deltaproteobacteria bacterium]|nr:hypothetical protein [Deltaproteobacteria bacterium]
MTEIDYGARKAPEVYKPLFDAEFAKLAELAGADLAAVQKLLDEIKLEGRGPWGYLTGGVSATAALLFNDKLKDALGYTWVRQLWEPSDQFAMFGGMTEDEVERDPDDYDTNYIVAEYYPEESREALAEDNYWGGGDADVVGLWVKDGVAKVYHAHMEGFWILGEDPVDFLQKEVAKILGKDK